MSPSTILVLIIAFWLCQPLIMHTLVVHKSRALILLAVLIFLWVTFFLGSSLHRSLSDRPNPIRIRPVFLILLWYPPAMQLIRYFHALSVGGKNFANHFGLTTFSRVTAFTLSVPAVRFDDDKKNDDIKRDGATGGSKFPTCDDKLLLHDFMICCMDLIVTVIICGFILYAKLDIILPNWMQRIVRVYIMGFSTTIIKLVLEIPSRILLQQCDNVSYVIPLYDRPYLTCSPRDLWRRWSVTAGYLYRKGFYEPLLQTTWASNDSNKNYFTILVATSCCFFVNCVLHIYWWSIVVKGSIDYSYIYLLFLFPIASFCVEDIIVRQLIFSSPDATKSSLHQLANYAVVFIGFYFIGQMMSDAHALPPTLTAVCRANVGLPVN